MGEKWRITSNFIGNTKMFAVYRLIDPAEIDHSGNREFFGGWFSDRSAAESLAETLNKELGEKQKDRQEAAESSISSIADCI